jgi:hypothetical protein
MKDYIVYEIFWEHCEYGGPCFSSGSTLHITRANAIQYKEQREKSSNNKPNGEDVYSYHGSEPQIKIVNKKEYDAVVKKDLK